MIDTSAAMVARQAAYYAQLSAAQRLTIVADMYETARALVLATLPPGLSDLERRQALFQRFYPELVGKIDPAVFARV